MSRPARPSTPVVPPSPTLCVQTPIGKGAIVARVRTRPFFGESGDVWWCRKAFGDFTCVGTCTVTFLALSGTATGNEHEKTIPAASGAAPQPLTVRGLSVKGTQIQVEVRASEPGLKINRLGAEADFYRSRR